jgi:general secretion pathway protein G
MKCLLAPLAILLVAAADPAEPPKKGAREEEKIKVARAQVQTISAAVETYKLNNGEYPDTLKDLTKPQPNGGAALLPAKALQDPWKRTYQYDPAGLHNGGLKADVWTVTPAKKLIGNWPEKKKR